MERARSASGLAAACLAAACALTLPVSAQEFPAKPVRIIIGFPPGGATDLVARLMAPKYTGIFKQQFIVDNRPGANGVIGSDLAAKAAPDGYAIHLATIGSLVLSPAPARGPMTRWRISRRSHRPLRCRTSSSCTPTYRRAR